MLVEEQLQACHCRTLCSLVELRVGCDLTHYADLEMGTVDGTCHACDMRLVGELPRAPASPPLRQHTNVWRVVRQPETAAYGHDAVASEEACGPVGPAVGLPPQYSDSWRPHDQPLLEGHVHCLCLSWRP